MATLTLNIEHSEIYHALDSVINGKELGGPGVVEYLRDQYIAQGGNIDFVPQKKALTKIFRKPQEQRTGFLEAAAKYGNVETVQLLSPHADETSKKESLSIAMRNRDTAALSVRLPIISSLLNHPATPSRAILWFLVL